MALETQAGAGAPSCAAMPSIVQSSLQVLEADHPVVALGDHAALDGIELAGDRAVLGCQLGPHLAAHQSADGPHRPDLPSVAPENHHRCAGAVDTVT